MQWTAATDWLSMGLSTFLAPQLEGLLLLSSPSFEECFRGR